MISQRTCLIELKAQATETNIWNSITEEQIQDASDETNSLGELEGLGDLGDLGVSGLPEKTGAAAGKKAGESGAKKKAKDDEERPKPRKTKDEASAVEIYFAGLPIAVQVFAGATRTILNDEGRIVYQKVLENDYGEISGTTGRDGDPIDCILGPNEDAPLVYIADMQDLGSDVAARQDEDKVLLGFNSISEATAAFKKMYPPSFLRGIEAVPIAEYLDRVMLPMAA